MWEVLNDYSTLRSSYYNIEAVKEESVKALLTVFRASRGMKLSVERWAAQAMFIG